MQDYCKNCGAKIQKNARFCPDCGKEVEKNLCPHCGAELDANSNFCEKCGKKITETTSVKLCPNCGQNLEDSENFCENCGTEIKEKRNFISEYKIPLIIIVTAAIVVFTIVITLSLTAHNDGGSTSHLDYGTQTVFVGNVKFEIPGDYHLIPSSINYGSENGIGTYEHTYSNGEEEITIKVLYSPGANVDANAIVQQTGGGSPKTMMGYDGLYGEFTEGYAFTFGIGNKVVSVLVSSPYVLDQVKVIG